MNYENKPPIYNLNGNYVFISYSHKSSDKVYEDIWFLKEHNINYWYDFGIEPGENWLEMVAPKLQKATVVLVYIDQYAFFSEAMEKEIRFIKENNIPYYPIFRNETYRKEKGKALSNEFSFSDERESLYDEMFKMQSGIVFDNQKSYYNQLLDKLAKFSVGNSASKLDRKKKVTRVCFLAKDSIFSKSIKEGIQEGFENSLQYTVDYLFVKKQYNVSEEIEFYNYLKNNSINYDIFIIRPLYKISEEVCNLILEITKTKKVILLDIDIPQEIRESISLNQRPLFVSSDFTTGGKKLAQIIIDTYFKINSTQTYVLLCSGPNKQSALERCRSLREEINKNDFSAIVNELPLDSFNAQYSARLVADYFSNNKDEISKFENLILFAGNDTIANNIIKLYCSQQNNPIKQALSKFKWIMICGYDGVKDISGESILANRGVNYCTIDVVPKKQGLEVAKIITSGNYNSDIVKVEPNVEKSIYCNPLEVKKLSDLSHILYNKKVFVFDLDGTMADTETLHWKAYNVILKQYGIQLSKEDFQRYIGNNEVSIYRMIEDDFGITIDTNDFLEKRLKAYIDLIEQTNLQPYYWVKTFIKNYKHANVFLLTSQVPEVVDYLFNYWKLDNFIPKNKRLSAHNGKLTKKEVFENIITYTSIENLSPHEVVVFEDSEHIINLAKSYGYEVIGIKHQFNASKLSNCDCIINQNYCEGVFVGLCGLDVVYKDIKAIPHEDSKLKSTDFYLDIGGPATKAAIIYTQMGGKATLITHVGYSPIGLYLKKSLKELGITVIDITNENILPNVSSIIVNPQKATRTIISGQNFTKKPILNTFASSLAKYDFVLYDCNFPNLTEVIVNKFRDANVPMVLDCGKWKDNIEFALDYADIAISSEEFVNAEGKDILQIKNDFAISMTAKTCGNKPIIYNCDGTNKTIDVQPIYGTNTLGAGDVFHGAFCYYYYNAKDNFEQALFKASQYVNQYLKDRKL